MAGEDVFKKLEQAVNKRDPNGVAALYAPEATAQDPLRQEPIQGKDAIKQDAEAYFKAFPDIQAKFTNIVGQGTIWGAELEFWGTQSGTLTGPLGTFPPTNKKLQIRGSTFVRVNDQGLITEEHRYYDTSSMAQQLGLGQQQAA